MCDNVEEDLEHDFALGCVRVVDEPVEKRGPAEVVNLVCRQRGEEERGEGEMVEAAKDVTKEEEEERNTLGTYQLSEFSSLSLYVCVCV